MPLALLLDIGYKLDSTLAEGLKAGECRRCFEDKPLTTIALNRNALWTPFVTPGEWHLLYLIMLLEVKEQIALKLKSIIDIIHSVLLGYRTQGPLRPEEQHQHRHARTTDAPGPLRTGRSGD